MIRRLDHVAVAVKDTEAALAYFRDRLGLRGGRRRRAAGGSGAADLPRPRQHLAPARRAARSRAIRSPRGSTTNGDGLHHICFGVDDVECELRRIGPPGVPVPPLGSGRGRPAGFTAGDPPHGVRIECTAFDPLQDAGALAGAEVDSYLSGA